MGTFAHQHPTVARWRPGVPAEIDGRVVLDDKRKRGHDSARTCRVSGVDAALRFGGKDDTHWRSSPTSISVALPAPRASSWPLRMASKMRVRETPAATAASSGASAIRGTEASVVPVAVETRFMLDHWFERNSAAFNRAYRFSGRDIIAPISDRRSDAFGPTLMAGDLMGFRKRVHLFLKLVPLPLRNSLIAAMTVPGEISLPISFITATANLTYGPPVWCRVKPAFLSKHRS